MPQQTRQRIVTLLKVLAAVGITTYLIYFVEWEQLVASARSARPIPLMIAGALLVVNLGLELWLWHRLVCSGTDRPRLRDSATAILCGHSLGLVTPARAGELLARGVYAGSDDAWQAGTMALVHRLFDFLAVLLVSLPAYLYFNQNFNPQPVVLWWGVTAVGAALLLLLGAAVAAPLRVHGLAARVVKRASWLQRLAFLKSWTADERGFLLMLALARYFVYVVQYALLASAFYPGFPIGQGLLLGALVFFGKLLIPPVTFTDVGIREGVSVYVSGFFALSRAAAFNAAFTLFVINLVLPALLGLPLLMRASRVQKDRTAPEPPPAAP